MIGGRVIDVRYGKALVFCLLQGSYGDREWRAVTDLDKARCVGTDDGIWWHGDHTLWTPAEKTGNKQGRSFDIDLGKSWSTTEPIEALPEPPK